jgi:hypothetical protein
LLNPAKGRFQITNQLLYQLSYSGINARSVAQRSVRDKRHSFNEPAFLTGRRLFAGQPHSTGLAPDTPKSTGWKLIHAREFTPREAQPTLPVWAWERAKPPEDGLNLDG